MIVNGMPWEAGTLIDIGARLTRPEYYKAHVVATDEMVEPPGDDLVKYGISVEGSNAHAVDVALEYLWFSEEIRTWAALREAAKGRPAFRYATAWMAPDAERNRGLRAAALDSAARIEIVGARVDVAKEGKPVDFRRIIGSDIVFTQSGAAVMLRGKLHGGQAFEASRFGSHVGVMHRSRLVVDPAKVAILRDVA